MARTQACTAILWLASTALYAPRAFAQAKPEQPPIFASSAGGKLLAGGNVWSTPSDIPFNYDGLGFAGSAGGFGWGAALYYEMRFFGHLGVEFDLGYDNSSLFRNVTINGIDTKETVSSSGVRLGLLAKGIASAPFGRLWIGIGPEFVIPSSTSDSLEISGQPNQDEIISSSKADSTMFTFALGLVPEVGEKVEIPIDLRAAKNLSQNSAWLDRVQVDPSNATRYSVTVQNSWDFRLALGVGYRF